MSDRLKLLAFFLSILVLYPQNQTFGECLSFINRAANLLGFNLKISPPSPSPTAKIFQSDNPARDYVQQLLNSHEPQIILAAKSNDVSLLKKVLEEKVFNARPETLSENAWLDELSYWATHQKYQVGYHWVSNGITELTPIHENLRGNDGVWPNFTQAMRMASAHRLQELAESSSDRELSIKAYSKIASVYHTRDWSDFVPQSAYGGGSSGDQRTFKFLDDLFLATAPGRSDLKAAGLKLAFEQAQEPERKPSNDNDMEIRHFRTQQERIKARLSELGS